MIGRLIPFLPKVLLRSMRSPQVIARFAFPADMLLTPVAIEFAGHLHPTVEARS